MEFPFDSSPSQTSIALFQPTISKASSAVIQQTEIKVDPSENTEFKRTYVNKTPPKSSSLHEIQNTLGHTADLPFGDFINGMFESSDIGVPFGDFINRMFESSDIGVPFGDFIIGMFESSDIGVPFGDFIKIAYSLRNCYLPKLPLIHYTHPYVTLMLYRL
jgi:hypothetical protein